MKFNGGTRTSLFWVVVAAQSLSSHAFSPATNAIQRAGTSQYGSLHAATLKSVDSQVSLDTAVGGPTSEDLRVVSDIQAYTKIAFDTSSGSLPKKVIDSALEMLVFWQSQESVEGAKMVDQLLERFEQEGSQFLDARHYSVAVEAWAISGHTKSAGRAEKALKRMEALANESSSAAAPTRQAYSAVVHAYADEGNASKAHDVLLRMEQSPNVTPTCGDYSAVLAAFSRTGNARRSEDILKRMVDLFKSGSKEFAPRLAHYHMVLDAWGRSNEAGAGQRARQILDVLQNFADQGELSLQPDERTYTCVMNNIVRGDDKDRVEQAEKLMKMAVARGIVPGPYLWTSAMQVYANQGAVEKTEELLKQLEDDGVANSAAYNTALKAWKESAAPDAPERAEQCLERMASLGLADTIGYTTVIAAYASRGDSKSAEKAESLLKKMQDLHQAGDARVKPNVQTVNSGMSFSILTRLECI